MITVAKVQRLVHITKFSVHYLRFFLITDIAVIDIADANRPLTDTSPFSWGISFAFFLTPSLFLL